MKLSELQLLEAIGHSDDPQSLMNTGHDGEKYLTKIDFLNLIADSTLPFIVWQYIDKHLYSKPKDYPIYARMVGDIVSDSGLDARHVDTLEILEVTGLADAGPHEFE